MNGEIQVLDGLVDDSLQHELNALAQGGIWKYGWKSNVMADRFLFWHAHFAGGKVNCRESCLKELKSLGEASPILRLWRLLHGGVLKGHVPLRVYGNAHTYGTEGYCHKDNEDKENYYSTVYYGHKVWDCNWGGELVFFDDNDEVIKSVVARPGRVVHFHGAIKHKVSSPGRECPDLRVSYVFKTQAGRSANAI